MVAEIFRPPFERIYILMGLWDQVLNVTAALRSEQTTSARPLTFENLNCFFTSVSPFSADIVTKSLPLAATETPHQLLSHRQYETAASASHRNIAGASETTSSGLAAVTSIHTASAFKKKNRGGMIRISYVGFQSLR